jgi:hypothetical protein
MATQGEIAMEVNEINFMEAEPGLKTFIIEWTMHGTYKYTIQARSTEEAIFKFRHGLHWTLQDLVDHRNDFNTEAIELPTTGDGS